MNNLSVWNFAIDFTGRESAALIVAERPDLIESSVSQPVLERMRRCYELARGWHLAKIAGEIDDGPAPDTMLQSIDMQWCQVRTDIAQSQAPHYFHRWLGDGGRSDFDSQRFTRQELVRWLSSIEMQSAYSFDLSASTSEKTGTVNSKAGRWPWGNHHTKLLGHLEAAAKEFWVQYDPANVKATAPKNDTVINWLVTERDVSHTVAGAMATILRIDGLRVGPRKEKVVPPQKSQ